MNSNDNSAGQHQDSSFSVDAKGKSASIQSSHSSIQSIVLAIFLSSALSSIIYFLITVFAADFLVESYFGRLLCEGDSGIACGIILGLILLIFALILGPFLGAAIAFRLCKANYSISTAIVVSILTIPAIGSNIGVFNFLPLALQYSAMRYFGAFLFSYFIGYGLTSLMKKPGSVLKLEYTKMRPKSYVSFFLAIFVVLLLLLALVIINPDFL